MPLRLLIVMNLATPILLACSLCLLGAATALNAATVDADFPPRWQPGPRGDLAFEGSEFLRQTSYRKPDEVADPCDTDGAHGPLNMAWNATHQGHWLIEEQRYGFDAIVAGISYHRQDLVSRGEKIFDWGFGQERADGSFDCPDRFHSASFFVEVAAHAALLLQASDLREQNQAWVDKMEPKLRLAAAWMMRPENEGPGRAHDAPYTHRCYLDACALGETGVLLHDEEMVKRSREYIRAGLRRQDPAGFNPEKGGWDTSYQVVGLLFAMDYYTLVANEEVRQQMQPMINRGLGWLQARVRPDGTVDQTGNTRTGLGQERGPQGNLKRMSYASAYRASYYWAMIMGNEHWARLAAALFQGQDVENREWKGFSR